MNTESSVADYPSGTIEEQPMQRTTAEVYAQLYREAADKQVDAVIAMSDYITQARINPTFDFETGLLLANRCVSLLGFMDTLRGALTSSKDRAEKIIRDRANARANDARRKAAKAAATAEESADE